jgi:hypothetical protein
VSEVDEDMLLQAFLQEVLPKIERIVTRALRDGRAMSELAFDLERGLDDKIRGGCAPRSEVANRWRAHPGLSEAKRNEIADLVMETSLTALPVVLTIIHQRFVLYGVRRLEGDVIGAETPKPN